MIDDKGRYQWSSSATKKLNQRIDKLTPIKPISEMTNDEKVIGMHTPIISQIDPRIALFT